MLQRQLGKPLAMSLSCRLFRKQISTAAEVQGPATADEKAAVSRVDALLEVSPLLLVRLPGVRNRALVASRGIRQGTLLFSEEPIVCVSAPEHLGKVSVRFPSKSPHMVLVTRVIPLQNCAHGTQGLPYPLTPAWGITGCRFAACPFPQVCDCCLKVFPPGFKPVTLAEAAFATFCSSVCMQHARQTYRPRHDEDGLNPLQPLLDRCREFGERFPLLVARLACQLLYGSPRTSARQSLQVKLPLPLNF